MSSLCRQNYHEESEAGINKQINLELYASYVYLSMMCIRDSDDVALKGCFKFFQRNSNEEREHAMKFMHYQNQRGGRVVLQDVRKPEKDEWGTVSDAMNVALALEKNVNQSLLDLHAIADKHGDKNLSDFIEATFLTEQTEAIKQLSEYVATLKRVGPGLGEFTFDKETLGDD
ncbi:soma ferritin-like [Anneissia japonica]|uniref:soma ferritin-like n=1 Tax=Anneissia japonica TaxID=1529436 RepID=UPI0014256DD3|nr:soma ferritin-like [Anneissia japonica]